MCCHQHHQNEHLVFIKLCNASTQAAIEEINLHKLQHLSIQLDLELGSQLELALELHLELECKLERELRLELELDLELELELECERIGVNFPLE
ncbi:hypothetical protein GQX74_009803 [Glossina fuscipes]|nr:hypothetical protein GQX74_009803 [Glossina fuscipes]